MLLLLTILLKSSESVGWKTPWKTTALYITSQGILKGIISTYTLTSAWYSKNNHRSTTATPHTLGLHCFTFAQPRVFPRVTWFHIVACILLHDRHIPSVIPCSVHLDARKNHARNVIQRFRVFMISCVACILMHEWITHGTWFNPFGYSFWWRTLHSVCR